MTDKADGAYLHGNSSARCERGAKHLDDKAAMLAALQSPEWKCQRRSDFKMASEWRHVCCPRGTRRPSSN